MEIFTRLRHAAPGGATWLGEILTGIVEAGRLEAKGTVSVMAATRTAAKVVVVVIADIVIVWVEM